MALKRETPDEFFVERPYFTSIDELHENADRVLGSMRAPTEIFIHGPGEKTRHSALGMFGEKNERESE